MESASPIVTLDAPPPPPPPPPPPAPEAASPGSSVIVTGTRTTSPTKSSDDRRASAFESRRGPDRYTPRPGQLTAGEHDDLLNPELYARYVDNFVAHEPLDGIPRVDTGRTLTIEVKDRAGRAVPFAPVTLTCTDGNSLSLATVADGTAAFFPDLDRLGSRVRVSVGGRASERTVMIDRSPGAIRQSITVGGAATPVRAFDLAVVIDVTGSMGDELRYLKSELRAITARLADRHPGLDIRIALIAYRDKGDDFVTRTYPFTANLGSVQTNLALQEADGGGDYPESVEVAMTRAAALGWRPGAVKSLLFVADAPPHAEDVAATWAATEALRARRVQIVPVAASGVAEGAEYIMRAMAAATQSRYLFLTDDSGIGNSHAPPAIDCYLVTRLDAAVRRVLDSQLSGRRIEPDRADVIRTVGTYDGGRCVLPRDFDPGQQQD